MRLDPILYIRSSPLLALLHPVRHSILNCGILYLETTEQDVSVHSCINKTLFPSFNKLCCPYSSHRVFILNVVCFFQSSVSHDVLCIQVKLIKQYSALTNSFPDLEPICCFMSSSNCCFLTCIRISQETGSGDLVLPSLSELSTVCCDPQSKALA